MGVRRGLWLREDDLWREILPSFCGDLSRLVVVGVPLDKVEILEFSNENVKSDTGDRIEFIDLNLDRTSGWSDKFSSLL
jgi:hypothetical protein